MTTKVRKMVSLSDLFSPEFMAKHTSCLSISQFFEGWEDWPSTIEDLTKLLSSTEWRNYVQAQTRFRNWNEMKFSAVMEFKRRGDLDNEI